MTPAQIRRPSKQTSKLTHNLKGNGSVSGLLLLVAIIVLTGARSADAAEGVGKGTPGTPWVGGMGITETVEQIMARESQEQDTTSHKRDHERRLRLHTNDHSQENPYAPFVAQWPIGTNFGRTPLLPQVTGASFLGAQFSESSEVPPDSMGAVGPTQVIVIVNGRIKLFSKAGGSLSGLNATTDNFFASVRGSSGTSDPHLRYDRLSGRWFVVMINIATHSNRILIAMSSGPTITNSTSFTFFQFAEDFDGGDAGLFADYPTLGVDSSALYIGVNNFTSSTGGNTTRAGFVVRKSSLLSGGPIVVTSFRNLDNDGQGNGIKTPQGVDNDDPAATEGYFIGVDSFTTGKLDIRRISDPGGNPTISPSLTLIVPSTAAPIPQAHKADQLGKKLDPVSDRLFAAAMHKNKLTGSNTLCTAHNIEVNSTGVGVTGGGRNGSRWYEIGNLTTTPSLIQAGTLFDSASLNAKGYWMPSVAISGQGHMALGCSYAASNAYAGVAVSGRLRTDPLGLIQPATLAVVSATAYNLDETEPLHRWGDFSQVVIDPMDDMTLWTFQEYCNAINSWGVRVVQLKAPPPATPDSATPASLTAGQTSNLLITGTTSSGSEFFDPGADPGGPGYSNHISATVNGGGVSVNSVTFSNITNVILNVSVAPDASAGDRTISVINPDGHGATSASTLLTILAPPSIAIPPQAQSFALGSDATFSVSASGTGPLSYQWRFNQVFINAATNSSYTRSNAQCSDAGAYDVVITNALGSVTSSVAALTIISQPIITSQPAATQTVSAGQPATFTVGATNDCGDSLTYQWRIQGIDIGGATASTLSLTNAGYGDGGDYTVLVSNLAGSITSAVATLTVLSPPVILQSPQDLAVSRGTDAVFSVSAVGTPPLSYQWRFNQAQGLGATGSSFARSNAQCQAAGSYDVVITNGYGSVTSSPAILTIVAPPQMVLQPSNQAIVVNQSAVFLTTATNECGGGLTYQWQFNGTNLAAATNNLLTVTNAQPSDAGNYALVVTNIAGSVTSVVAVLTVVVPPLANFNAAPTSGPAALTVFFTNLSTAASVYLWDFGDGNASIAVNPSNTYTNPGTYSVILTAIGSGFTNTLTQTNYILVLASPQLVVGPTSLDFGLVFTNLAAYSAVTFSNAGSSVLSATTTISGGPFAILNPSSNAVSSFAFDLPSLNSTNIPVVFSPLTVGSFSNALAIVSNGGQPALSLLGQGISAPVILSPAATGTGFSFSFETVTGKTYSIQYKVSLNDSLWQTLQAFTGTGVLQFFTNSTPAAAHGFYRLTAQ